MTPKMCPNCKTCLEGDDIYQFFLNEYKDEEKALEKAFCYGWTKENPEKFSRCLGTYCMVKDMIVAWECPDCNHKWDGE